MKNSERSPHLYNIATVLMQLYSSSNTIWKSDAYADAKRNKVIDQPNPVVYGTTVPESVWSSLTPDNLIDGMLARWMIFESSKGFVDLQDPSSGALPDSIIDQARHWIEYQPGGNLQQEHPCPFVATHTDDADKRIMGHLRAIAERRQKEDTVEAAIWSRSGEKAAKLALIFAASRQSNDIGNKTITISLGDVDAAIALANWMTRTIILKAIDNVTLSRYEDDLNRMKRSIRRQRKWISRKKISQLCRWAPSRYRSELLSDLIEQGSVKTKPQKRATVYRCD